ncbi:MAG TPA: hypothetical protein VHO06_03410, partial [Polyangia bacterium]|nr:hypothetical protein [Polyangia bacterium]
MRDRSLLLFAFLCLGVASAASCVKPMTADGTGGSGTTGGTTGSGGAGALGGSTGTGGVSGTDGAIGTGGAGAPGGA